MDKTLLDRELDLLRDSVIRGIARRVLDECPEPFWTVSASFTGKYHPEYARGNHGLVCHSKAVFTLAGYLIDMMGSVPRLDSDAILAAALLHDTYKHLSGDKYTNFSHPLAAADATRAVYEKEFRPKLSDQDRVAYDYAVGVMTYCIATHMGRYNTSTYEPETILPLPDYTLMHTIVHIADYLAARTELVLESVVKESKCISADSMTQSQLP